MLRILLVSLCVAQVVAIGQPLPSAKEIIEKYEKITGSNDFGKSSQMIVSKLTSETQGISGKSTVWQAGGRTYSVVEVEGAGKTETGNNGDVEWEVSDVTGPKVIRVASKPGNLLHESELVQTAWEDVLANVKGVRAGEVDGRPCYIVTSEVRGSGGSTESYFDRESGLLVRSVSRATPEATGVETRLGDYRDVAGRKFPFRIHTRMIGGDVKLEVLEVKLDATPPERLRVPPDEIVALAAKWKTTEVREVVAPDPDRPKIRRTKKK
jgi:hypothetical protein